MKRILLSGLLLGLVLPILAQETGDISSDASLRKWEDGPLTLKEFSYRTGSSSDKAMMLSYGIRWMDEKHKFGNTTFNYPVFFTYMNPYASWIKPEYRNEEYLQYVQTYFDYVELCKRRAQKEVLRQGNQSINYTVNFHMEVADGFYEKLEEETLGGTDTAAVRICHERVAAELAAEENDAFVPDFKINPKGSGMGMHIGLGSELHQGNMGIYMPPLVGLEFGFDFFFNRWTIYWDGLLAFGGDLKRDLSYYPRTWQAGKSMKGGNINISAGFSAFDSQWWKVTPLAGIGVDFIDYPKSAARDEKTEIAAFRALAGVNVDYKFSRFVEKRGLVESAVRFRLYGAFNNYPVPIGSSWSLNFSLGVNWLALYLK